MSIEEFWNKISAASPMQMPNQKYPVLLPALNYLGDLNRTKLLDLGCGDGSTSLFFAQNGADVTSIEINKIGIENLSQSCFNNDICCTHPILCSTFDIVDLG